MYISPRQFVASIILSVILLTFIVRLIQKGRLDIAYCWLWLAIGLGTILVVVKYEWLAWISDFMGAKTNTTTLFLLGFFVVLLLCLQFSLVISLHRRQIKRLVQRLAIIESQTGK